MAETTEDFQVGDYVELSDVPMNQVLRQDSKELLLEQIKKPISCTTALAVGFESNSSVAWLKQRFRKRRNLVAALEYFGASRDPVVPASASETPTEFPDVIKRTGGDPRCPLPPSVEAARLQKDLDQERHRAQKLADECGLLRKQLDDAYSEIGRLEAKLERAERDLSRKNLK